VVRPGDKIAADGVDHCCTGGLMNGHRPGWHLNDYSISRDGTFDSYSVDDQVAKVDDEALSSAGVLHDVELPVQL
jgi:hypothetical protein